MTRGAEPRFSPAVQGVFPNLESELNVGGAGTGVYRTSRESSELEGDGIRDGVRRLLGNVKGVKRT